MMTNKTWMLPSVLLSLLVSGALLIACAGGSNKDADNPSDPSDPDNPADPSDPDNPAEPSPDPDPELLVPPEPDADGFSEFVPGADTTTFYVSADGDDGNDGTSEDSPLLTAQAALDKVTDGVGDWILFKRGDRFDEIGQLAKSGHSVQEPLLLGAYGDAQERPTFRQAFVANGSNGSPESIDFIAVVGLRFYNHRADPADPEFTGTENGTGVTWLRGTQSLWIEDCVFRFSQLSLQKFDEAPVRRITLFRTQIIDNYDTGSHAQGVFAKETEDLTMEECLFDHNGWIEDVAGGESTKFNHNIYIQNGTRGTVVKNSIIMRGSSHGMQLRGGGIAENNFLYRNPISILIGGGTTPDEGGVTGTIKDNVIYKGVDMDSGEPRGWGIGLENINEVDVTGNMMLACEGTMCRSMDVDTPGVTYADNFVQDWGTDTDSVPGPVPVTLEDYLATIGLETEEEFYAALREQSRFNYREELTAAAINEFFRNSVNQ